MESIRYGKALFLLVLQTVFAPIWFPAIFPILRYFLIKGIFQNSPLRAPHMVHASHIDRFMEFELLGYNYGVSQELSIFSLFTDFITSSYSSLFTSSLNSLKLTFLKSSTYVSQNQMTRLSFLADTIQSTARCEVQQKIPVLSRLLCWESPQKDLSLSGLFHEMYASL